MTARLHVLLGAGGVGKTTLAAGYALALARRGGRVGLLGIDPSRRLQGALGVELPDVEVPVPHAGELRAAILRPEKAMRRWAAATCTDADARDRLLRNPFFLALADRLATATDLLAAVRVAEWAEDDPALDDLVVDTAPGLNAIEFLRRPQRLSAFLEGHLVAWLRRLADADRGGPLGAVLRGGARRVVGGLARIGGTRMLLDLADFLSLARDLFTQMLERVEAMQRWLEDPSTEIVLVTSVSDDAAVAARQIGEALTAVNLAPRATVINRAMPPGLGKELGRIPQAALGPEAEALVRYVKAYAAMQERVVRAVTPLSSRVVVMPASPGLDEADRAEALAGLGARLLDALVP